jgi:hypothetical protein
LGSWVDIVVYYLGIPFDGAIPHPPLVFMANGFSSSIFVAVKEEDPKEAFHLEHPNMEKRRDKVDMETLQEWLEIISKDMSFKLLFPISVMFCFLFYLCIIL